MNPINVEYQKHLETCIGYVNGRIWTHMHRNEGQESQITEDAEFEVIEPKQIEFTSK